MKYSVATFETIWDENLKLNVREYVVLGKNLDMEDAKNLKLDNRGSWTYPEHYAKENK